MPNWRARRDQIVDIISTEERRFNQTLTLGMQLLTRELDALEKAGKHEVPGELAFKLYDTHGFPVELTAEVARERGMTVDRAGYDGAMLRQQEQQAQSGHVFVREQEEEAWTKVSNGLPTTSFTGYEGDTGEQRDRRHAGERQTGGRSRAPHRQPHSCWRRRHSTPRRAARWATTG